MRRKGTLARHAGRLVFTAAYVCLAVPFTSAFFSEFLSPPEGAWQPLYAVGLPLFLGCLEYASVSLARLVWRERKAELMLLFLACQSLAVSSAYFEGRAAEWRAAVGSASRAAKGANDADQKAYVREKERRASMAERLRAARADAAAVRRQIEALGAAPAAGASESDPLGTLEEARVRQRDRSLTSLRTALKADVDEIARIGKRLDAMDLGVPATARSAAKPAAVAPSALTYAAETFLTGRALVSLLIALALPCAVLAVGRLLAAEEEPTGPLASVDLRRELDEGAALPTERHDSYAALMEPVLAAHVASVRAARSAAARGLALSIELDAEIDVLATVAGLRDQIEESALSPSARQRLVAFVDRLLSEGLEPSPPAA